MFLRKVTALLVSSICFCSSCMPIHAPSHNDQMRSQKMLERGVLSLRNGDFGDAELSFQLAHEMVPQAAALDGLGCAAFARDDLALAEEFFEKALLLDSEYYEAYGHLADVYMRNGEVSRALEHYQIAREHSPQDFRIRNNYAVSLLEAGGNESRKRRGQWELKKTAVLSEHPLVQKNIKLLQSEIQGSRNE